MNEDYRSRNVDMLYGIDNITNAIEKFIDETKTTFDVCADSTMPSFIIKKSLIRKFLDFKNNRNGHIRYITEVTGENIGYCKQIMEAAQLRHLEGPKGVFRVNETECQYNVVLDEPRQIAIMIRSNMNEIVSQYKKVFDILWEKATPIKGRLPEIEGVGNTVSVTNEEKQTASNVAVTSRPRLKEHQQSKESIEKETEALLNTRIPDYNKNPPQSSIKIQLWSNNSKTDYAIKLKDKSEFLAATRQDATEGYTDLVEESDYLGDVQYDWNYTLRHWIDNHASNLISEITDFTSVFTRASKRSDNEIYNSPILKEIQNKTYSSQKGTFKCNYCKLMFTSKIKRKEHEFEWHNTTTSR